MEYKEFETPNGIVKALKVYTKFFGYLEGNWNTSVHWAFYYDPEKDLVFFGANPNDFALSLNPTLLTPKDKFYKRNVSRKGKLLHVKHEPKGNWQALFSKLPPPPEDYSTLRLPNEQEMEQIKEKIGT